MKPHGFVAMPFGLKKESQGSEIVLIVCMHS
jgi:hypothetical protein